MVITPIQSTSSLALPSKLLKVPNRNLRNDDGDAVYNVGSKVNLNFTNQSRDTQRSFSLFFRVKTISKLKMEHSVKLEVEI